VPDPDPHANSPETDAGWLQLTGRNVLVSGGTRNVGRAVAEGFADAGANVAVIGGSDRGALEETLASLGQRAVRSFGVIQPLEESSGPAAAVDACAAELGPIDVLVNVAAVRPHVEGDRITAEDFDHVLAINLRAPFLLSQAVIPPMREQGFGRIINFSGINAYWGRKNRSHVVTSKGGIIALTRALALDTAQDGITVNTVVPATIDTERSHPEWYPDAQARRARQLERIPMGRLGTTDEVVSVVLFLASPRASYVTAQEVFVTGGSFPLVAG
jgi:3-oxoacyl-[acyl-carrier protein] reductase